MVSVVAKSEESQSINDNIDKIEDNEPPPVDDLIQDKDYEQVDEADDETTMEEEEALPELEDPLREIRFLEEESNMPIHELMVMYGYSKNTAPETSTKKKKKKKKKSSSKKSKDKKRKKKLSTSSDGVSEKRSKSTDQQRFVEGDPSNKMSEETSKENESVKEGEDCSNASQLLNLYMAELDQVQSEDEDEDYRPYWELHWKSVNVGLNFQALVTEELSTYGDVLPYENNDELLWDPNVLGEDLIEDYLTKIQQITKALKPKSKVVGVRDNEKALYLLVQCGHDVAEALRRMSLNVIPLEKSLSVWSEDETLKFEMGLLVSGKNFHAIQKEVKTRSVAELVHFYYFWKKSDRHDQFERKQVSMRPEIKQWQHWDSEEDQDSDFDTSMFAENSHDDSEDSLNAAENKAQMKCLIYADRKRQVRKKAANNACSNTNSSTNTN
ncbi:mesoderm induction early response protein 1-like isoform X1 [Aphis craccivora]|uniref:Mesoderm induction early response protein 1-like isoform X1 n=1 Tax=Aphis craccivora TaxID=307492 RepID=A0A6G0YTE2_APHCR|nr:mesoderm induction early response protein 1-like isoform X1 [Aphis craccivora]